MIILAILVIYDMSQQLVYVVIVTLSMSSLCGCHGNTVVNSSGSVKVYGGDESSGEWNLSYTL